MVTRRAIVALSLALVGLLAVSCASDDGDGTSAVEAEGLRIASFDFPESALLAEMYAQAIESGGVPVVRLGPVGPREIVAPALELGHIDLVPEYLGSALGHWESTDPDSDPASAWADLNARLVPRGMMALPASAAEDKNVFVVTSTAAGVTGLESLSDLADLAEPLTFGGPAECADRPLCLVGLSEVYGIEFAEFVPQRSLSFTAEALDRGEIDVGLMFSTAPELGSSGLFVLEDDRDLQPAENIIPLVRSAALDRWGPAVSQALDEISARLTTVDLRLLNLRVAEGASIEDTARDWLTGEVGAGPD